MGSDYENAVDMVMMGYEENTRNLAFRVGFTTWGDGVENAIAAIKAVGPYNAFEPDTVIEQLQAHWPKIRYIEVGREGSPVIYITVSDDKDKDTIELAMTRSHADELDWEGHRNNILRAWFD